MNPTNQTDLTLRIDSQEKGYTTIPLPTERYRKRTRHEIKQAMSESHSKKDIETIRKLEAAFQNQLTIKQACGYADISLTTYYVWIKDDPALHEKFERARNNLNIKSKENIALRIHGKPVSGDIDLSKWLLSKKEPEEYGDKIKLKVGEDVGNEATPLDKFEEQLRKEYEDRIYKKLSEPQHEEDTKTE